MDAEKMAMQRRIDTLDQYANRLHAALTEAERENARLKVELETVMRALEEEKANHQHTLECAQQFEKDWLKMKREMDVVMYDLLHLACDCIPACSICKHYTIDMKMCQHVKEIGAQDIDDCFEWRGPCEENGGVEDAQG